METGYILLFLPSRVDLRKLIYPEGYTRLIEGFYQFFRALVTLDLKTPSAYLVARLSVRD